MKTSRRQFSLSQSATPFPFGLKAVYLTRSLLSRLIVIFLIVILNPPDLLSLYSFNTPMILFLLHSVLFPVMITILPFILVSSRWTDRKELKLTPISEPKSIFNLGNMNLVLFNDSHAYLCIAYCAIILTRICVSQKPSVFDRENLIANKRNRM